MHALKMTLAPREGALVRVLGLIERRGFVPIRLGVEPSENGNSELSLVLKSSRPVELLTRQLDRLLEVSSVEVM